MKIDLKEITIKKLSEGFLDSDEQGVVAYGGTLDIRPPYQREFIYKDKQRNAVIESVRQGFPLNTMYWAVRDNGTFEVIDGQQRILSICQYVSGVYSIGGLYFHSLQSDQQQQILDYEVMVYFCTGTPTEKLNWFTTINIAGEEHTAQELRNAVYAGSWTADAKRHFSKTGCAAHGLAHDYLIGSPIRQEYLETAIDWCSDGEIKEYMSKHQHDKNATPLWQYFKKVIVWVKATFPVYRREMRGLPWGFLYNEFKDVVYDTKELEERILALIDDDEVGSHGGIYLYLLTGKEKYLNLRQFDDKIKRRIFERQKGICPDCKKHFDFEEMEGDHEIPWHKGGKTVEENCRMRCRADNREKSGK